VSGIGVEGLVAARDKQPYVVLFVDGARVAQLTMAQARNVARDIERMCARTEADAMIHKFFEEMLEAPPAAGAAMMLEFRKFRSELDAEPVEKTETTPSSDPPVN
jgi:hypothetical protein